MITDYMHYVCVCDFNGSLKFQLCKMDTDFGVIRERQSEAWGARHTLEI